MIYLSFPPVTGDRLSSHEASRAAARALLAYGLKREYGLDAARLPFHQNEFGKPLLPPMDPPCYFSLTHCPGLAACCIGSRPVGVDAEAVRPGSPHAARRCFCERERLLAGGDETGSVFFRLWTLKESYGKAVGRGLCLPLREIPFSFKGDILLPGFSGAAFWQKRISGPGKTVFWLSACRLGEAGDGFINRTSGSEEPLLAEEALLEVIEWKKLRYTPCGTL